MRTRPPEERRNDLIAAAVKVVSREGVHAATVAKIANEAGVSVGSIAFHFDGKDRLLKAVLCSLVEEKKARWNEQLAAFEGSVADQILATCEVAFDFPVDVEEKISAWFSFHTDETWRNEYHLASHAFELERAKFLEVAVFDLIKEGGYSNLEPRPIASALIALSTGLAVEVMFSEFDSFQKHSARSILISTLKNSFPKHFDSLGASTPK